MGERAHYGEVWTACHFLDECSVAVEQGSSNGDSFHRAPRMPVYMHSTVFILLNGLTSLVLFSVLTMDAVLNPSE